MHMSLYRTVYLRISSSILPLSALGISALHAKVIALSCHDTCITTCIYIKWGRDVLGIHALYHYMCPILITGACA
jgi:hypothetical protein